MTGPALLRMRERECVSRYYISRFLDMPMYDLSLVEMGQREADATIVDGYHAALDYVRRNSLPKHAHWRLIWSAPTMTEKLEKLMT